MTKKIYRLSKQGQDAKEAVLTAAEEYFYGGKSEANKRKMNLCLRKFCKIKGWPWPCYVSLASILLRNRDIQFLEKELKKAYKRIAKLEAE